MCSAFPAIPHVCYYVFSFRPLLFADERDKKRFLDFVLPRIAAPDRSILAFVLLDDEFHLEAAHLSRRLAAEEAGRIRAAVNMACRGIFMLREGTDSAGEDGAEGVCDMRQSLLFGSCQILGTCRYIHRLPLLKGYAYGLRDYWWSSMQTYLGSYCWSGLEMRPVAAMYCQDDPREGLRRFLAAQGEVTVKRRKQCEGFS